jgi:hypothetical protein
VAVIGFCGYGIATGSPSTLGYTVSVLVIAAGIAWLRRTALPGLLAMGRSLGHMPLMAIAERW